ncbi:hypothetical protein CRE_26750 [Caenorhabditis remanei]|uniref:BTB domain-containing protein n=1 Tax=Caenorhabditis remanei TaxID=31234 RepID=E3MXU8_CAERE|nr:hypothetical protein CRE_26750 [Caenorhabditis remanei]
MVRPGKFMVSRTFHNVEHSNDEYRRGPENTINGMKCYICCIKTNVSNWECWLGCTNYSPSLGWKVVFKIGTNNGVETVGTSDGRIEDSPGISFRNNPKYFVYGHMTIECHVEVYEVDKNGIRIPPRLFDESMKEYSDVVLIVEKKKFYVLKLVSMSTVLWGLRYYLQFLASESSYFKSLFIGSFEESKKYEISLKDVEAKYFQLFLESLYGDPVINDETVDGILKLADMFDAKRVIQKCEVYLIEESKKTLKEKLDLAVKFNSNELKETCLCQIKTVNDVRSVMSENPKEMDPDVLAFFCEKLLYLSK